jgi:MFS family permease
MHELPPPARDETIARTSAPSAPVKLVCVIVVLEASLYSTLTPLIPHYVRVLGLSDREVGVLVACYTLGIAAGSFLGAWLAGRFGVRRTSQVALCLLAATCALFGLSESVVVLDVSRLLGGVAGGCVWAAGLTWIMSATPEPNRGAAIGTAFGAGIVGTLIGPGIGTVALALGITAVFCALAGLALVLAVVISRHQAPAVLIPENPIAARRALRDPGVATGVWLLTLVALGYGVLYVVVPLRMESLGAADWHVAVVFLLTAAVSAVGATVMGRAADRHGPRRPARVALAISIPCLALAAVPPSIVLLGALTVVGIGAGLSTVATAGATLLSQAAERIGVGLAAVSVVINLCFSVGETFGSLASAFVVAMAPYAVPLWLIAGAALITMVRLARRSDRPCASDSCGEQFLTAAAARTVGRELRDPATRGRP